MVCEFFIKMKKLTIFYRFLAVFGLFSTNFGYAQQIRVHDPVAIKEGNTYYIYCTGHGISTFSSPDLKNWE